jgi:hypothetical protein
MRKTCALAAILMCGALSAQAAASTPFNAGNGYYPGIDVGADGSAYVAWHDPRSGTSADPAQVQFCRVAPGGSSCAVSSHYPFPWNGSIYQYEGSGTVSVFLRNGQPVLIHNCEQCGGGHNGTSEYVSTDNGVSFSPRTGTDQRGLIGTMNAGPDSFYDATNDIFYDLDVANFQQMPGGTERDNVGPWQANYTGYGLGILGSGPNLQLVAVWTNSGELRFKYTNPGANVSDPSLWQGGDASIGSASEMDVATGPAGLYVLTTSLSDGVVQVRKWDAALKTFDAPVTISSTANGEERPSEPDLFEDTSGRLHAVWYHGQDTPLGYVGIRYSSSPDGAVWTPPQLITKVTKDPYGLRVAGLGDAGKGWVAWSDNNTSGAIVHVAPLTPAETDKQPPSPKPTPTPTPTPTPHPKAQPAFPAHPATRRVRGHKVSVLIKGTLKVPSGTTCSGAVTAKLASTTKHATLTKGCAFRTTVTRKRTKHEHKLVLKLSYPGSDTLLPASRSYKIRV